MADKVPGAYIVTHDETGLFYVGSTDNLARRGYAHKTNLNSGKHSSKKLQVAYTTSPHVTIQKMPTQDREQAFDAEQRLLDQNRNNPLMVNVATDARLSTKGKVHTEAFKQHLRDLNVGKVPSEETRRKMSAGRIASGSEPQRAHIVALNKSRAGVPLAESTKNLMSEQRKGVPKSQEHAQAIGDALRGKPKTAEHVAKVQASRAGFKHDEKTKARIAEKVKATLAAKKAASEK